jgi:type II secretory pathway predicted ATPase ExeA
MCSSRPDAIPNAVRRPPKCPAEWIGSFGLSADPFADRPDPGFYVDLPAHREAIAVLEYGIAGRKGILLLTGPAGAGKTTVLECLAGRLRARRIEFARILNSRITVEELYESIAYELDLPVPAPRKTTVLVALQDRAVSRAASSSTLAVLVDDAHRLSMDVLEELELLNNIENRTGKLIQVVLAGEFDLASTLDQPRLRSLHQRIMMRAKLKTLAAADTAKYIETRLAIARAPRPIFDPAAIHAIYRASGGVPRLINRYCSASMEQAFAAGKSLSAELIESVVQILEPGEDNL